MSIDDALWEVWEKYLETKLFRDSNMPEVNALLTAMHEEVKGVVLAERERAARHADEGYRWEERCDDIAKRIRSGEAPVV